MPAIHLLPLGDVPPELLRRLVAPLQARFAAPVFVDPAVPARAEWFQPIRDQYDAEAILRWLVSAAPRHDGWRLALLDGDLFVPGLRFAFGLSTLAGCCGVVGLARLRPSSGTAAARDHLFLQRVLTETVHEIGHIAGLNHCDDPHCVMHFSLDLRDTDRKGSAFCEKCRWH